MLSSLTLAVVGMALVAPSVAVLGAATVTIGSCLLYTRRVADPALLASGSGQYAAQTGRLIPGIGRVRANSAGSEPAHERPNAE